MSLTRKNAAFTALEVMFALAIMAIAMTALIATLSSSGALRQQGRETEVAMRELSVEMERLRGMPISGIVALLDDQAVADGRALVITGGVGVEDDGTTKDGTITTSGGTVNVLRGAKLTATLLSEAKAKDVFGLATLPDFDGTPGASIYSQYRVAPVRFEIEWTAGPDELAPQKRTLVTIYYPQRTVGS